MGKERLNNLPHVAMQSRVSGGAALCHACCWSSALPIMANTRGVSAPARSQGLQERLSLPSAQEAPRLPASTLLCRSALPIKSSFQKGRPGISCQQRKQLMEREPGRAVFLFVKKDEEKQAAQSGARHGSPPLQGSECHSLTEKVWIPVGTCLQSYVDRVTAPSSRTPAGRLQGKPQ
jgi:hypothetical protein